MSELCGDLRDRLQEAFPSLWVVGEVQRLRPSRRGHVYFELVEKGTGDEIVGKLEGVIWRSDYRRVAQSLEAAGLEIVEGHQIRCRGSVDFYPPFGRLQLVVREVDAVFSEGRLALARRRTLEALASAGLLDRNRRLPFPELPLRLALITSRDSAAYHDFLSTLRESGYGFSVVFLHAAVQGRGSEAELVSAVEALAGLSVDCAAVVRGGGARSDLAVFDSRPLAEAIARSPVPVVTGLGHEIDEAIADRVAHTAAKTPTKAAELLVERLRRAEAALTLVETRLSQRALEPLRRAAIELERAERRLVAARHRLDAASARLAGLTALVDRAGRQRLGEARQRLDSRRRRLALAAPRLIAARRPRPERAAAAIAAQARRAVGEARARVAGWNRLCEQLAPERTLHRGFTITRDSRGRLLRGPDQATAGERITTRFAAGSLVSRIEER